MVRIKILFSFVVISLLAAGPVMGDLAKPAGPVILTIGGVVSGNNRGPSDTFDDAFLAACDHSGGAAPARCARAAGWNGSKITTVALDGFAVEISAADIAAHDWILALKSDGAYFGIGGHGPAWLVYEVAGGTATADDESRWPWAVFYIAAE